ncbi:MAG: nucleoside-diphosphate-sugar epimerase, partial [Enterobacterales bacterium]
MKKLIILNLRFGLIRMSGNSKQRLSILGSGWLGFPLAEALKLIGYDIFLSTTSEQRATELSLYDFSVFIVNIDILEDTLQPFLQSKILIINIPSKNINGYINLINIIEKSTIEKIIFISSTSVYLDQNKTIHEDDIDTVKGSDLFSIEQLFINNKNFQTTIVRFGGLIGYQRHPANFIKKQGLMLNPKGRINMIHRDDCISIIQGIIDKNLWDEVFNAVADEHPTREDF